MTRRALIGALAGTAAFAAATAYYSSAIEPFWLDVSKVDIAVPGWPTALAGLKICHLTDLHVTTNFPQDYLDRIAKDVLAAEADIVVVTGDLTTHEPESLPRVASWLASLKVPVYVSLGNHDYDPETSARPGCTTLLADQLMALAKGTTVRVLRNAHEVVTVRGQNVAIIGLEDYFSGRLDPGAAVNGLNASLPKIWLNHNPDAADYVTPQEGLILAGHTHGGQLRLPWFGAILLPIVHSERDVGLHNIGNARLYVSRGIGYLAHARFLCRPELAVVTIA